MTPEEVAATIRGVVPGDLADRIAFLVELDRLKSVERRSFVGAGARRENSAEHSWHLALFAWVLAPFATETVDVDRVVRMLLVHDIVEIDAGDTFVYDEAARAAKADAEAAAADRIFGMLPTGTGTDMAELWQEYEERATPEARFAYAVDRLQPLLLNVLAGGRTWRESGITADRVHAVNASIADGSNELWNAVAAVLAEAQSSGILEPGPEPGSSAGSD